MSTFRSIVVLYVKNSGRLVEVRYAREELQQASAWWQERLRTSIDALPAEWIEQAFSRLGTTTDPSVEPAGA